jgi:hypothetical protein
MMFVLFALAKLRGVKKFREIVKVKHGLVLAVFAKERSFLSEIHIF